MEDSIKQKIEALSRCASNMDDDAEFMEVTPLYQRDLMEMCLQGVHHGMQESTIGEEELVVLRLYWRALSTNICKLVHINKYYRLLLEGKEIPEDLQQQIDRYAAYR